MKTTQILIAVGIFFSNVVKAQAVDDVAVSGVKGISIDVKSDEELNKKTPVSVNHEKYQNKFMKMIINENYKSILKICAAKEFTGFLTSSGDNLVQLKNADDILPILRLIREDIPLIVSIQPESITEEFVFNDIQRVEVWNYTDKKGISRSLRVTYFNDQILCVGFF